MEQNTSSERTMRKVIAIVMAAFWGVAFYADPKADIVSDFHGFVFQFCGLLLLLRLISYLVEDNKVLEAKVEKFANSIDERMNKFFRIKS